MHSILEQQWRDVLSSGTDLGTAKDENVLAGTAPSVRRKIRGSARASCSCTCIYYMQCCQANIHWLPRVYRYTATSSMLCRTRSPKSARVSNVSKSPSSINTDCRVSRTTALNHDHQRKSSLSSCYYFKRSAMKLITAVALLALGLIDVVKAAPAPQGITL